MSLLPDPIRDDDGSSVVPAAKLRQLPGWMRRRRRSSIRKLSQELFEGLFSCPVGGLDGFKKD
jgi:hypothetical protein